MNVAIFGGTGFVGQYLVEALCMAGHTPSLLVRSRDAAHLPTKCQVRTTAGEIGSEKAILETLAGCDAAIFNIGILRAFPKQGITFEALQLEAAKRTVDAMRQAGVRRLLLMSANGVKSPGTPYQETKLKAEQYAQQSGLDVTVFRPSVVFGDPRSKMEFATQLYRDMVAPPLPAVAFFSGFSPTRGAVTMSPVFVEDVADAFVAALGRDDTIGKTYRLGGPEVLTWKQMIERIAAASGRAKWIFPMPIAAMRFAAALLDRFSWFPVTRDQLTMLEEGNTAEVSELESLTGKTATRFVPETLQYLRSD